MKKKNVNSLFTEEIQVFLKINTESSIEMNGYFESLSMPKEANTGFKLLYSFWIKESKLLLKDERKVLNFIFLFSKLFDYYKAELVLLKKDILQIYEKISKSFKSEVNLEVRTKFQELGTYIFEELSNALVKDNNKKIPHISKVKNKENKSLKIIDKLAKKDKAAMLKFDFGEKIDEDEINKMKNETDVIFHNQISKDYLKTEKLDDIAFKEKQVIKEVITTKKESEDLKSGQFLLYLDIEEAIVYYNQLQIQNNQPSFTKSSKSVSYSRLTEYNKSTITSNYKKIQYISINNLLNLLLYEKISILKDISSSFNLIKFTLFFIQQHKFFITRVTLFEKIKSILELALERKETLHGLSTFLIIYVFYLIYQLTTEYEAEIILKIKTILEETLIHEEYLKFNELLNILLETILTIQSAFSSSQKLSQSSIRKFNEYIINYNHIKDLISLSQLRDRRATSFSDDSIIHSRKELIDQGFKDSDEISIYDIDDNTTEATWIFDILLWPAIEIAKQLTIQTHEIVSQLQPDEFFNCAWGKKNKEITSPNIIRLIERFNLIFYWIIEEILRYDKKSIRCKVIEKFICVALFLNEFQNYNDLVLIVSALNSNIIKKLESTLSMTGQVYKKHWIELTNLCSHEKNYYELRKHQSSQMKKGEDNDKTSLDIATGLDYDINISKKASTMKVTMIKEMSNESMKTSENDNNEKSAMIPYLGLLLRDISFCIEGCTYTKDGHFVNVDLIYLQGNLINDYIKHKTIKYNFRKNNYFEFLKKPSPLSEDKLYEMLDQLEPKFTLYPTKSVEKRPSNTDKCNFILTKNLDGIDQVVVIFKKFDIISKYV